MVDWFVLTEAAETYSGKPRELTFNAHRERFLQYSICYVKVPRYPPGLGPREREAYSRDSMLKALRTLRPDPDALVLLSDIDEIPRAEAVVNAAEEIRHGAACCVFEQALSYYFVNCRTEEPWHGTRMARCDSVTSPQELRFRSGAVMPDGGWHFSYLGGASRIQEKIGASIHTELDLPEFRDEAHIERCIATASDLFGRPISFRIVPVDYSFPKVLVEQQDQYASLIAPAPLTWPGVPPLPVPDQQVRTAARSQALSPAPVPPLEELYLAALHSQSDIHEHLPFLYRLASTVKHITELGTRRGHSTLAFLRAAPERLVSYDLERSEQIEHLERVAEAAAIQYEFRQEDVLTAALEETDLLFIDTWHVEEQMRQELSRHAPRARRYLVLHDTETYGERGETEGHRGIWPAVAEYMRVHPEWSLLQHFPGNNGLTVFVRYGVCNGELRSPQGGIQDDAIGLDAAKECGPGPNSDEIGDCQRDKRRLQCPLSPALLELLQACAEHHTVRSAELAPLLCRSSETIRTEFKRIRERLNVHSREDAVAVAMICGWIRGRRPEGDSLEDD